MQRMPLSMLVLGSALVSIAMLYPTDLPAGDKSSQGASVSAGGVSVSAGRGGASVSADRGGTSVSADRGGASVSSGGASVSADRGGASVSSGGASVSADRGGANVSSGGASVSADRGRSSASVGRGDADVGGGVDGRAPAVQADRPVGDRSYGSIGEWFDDMRSSWFGDRNKRSDDMKTTTTSSSATSTTHTTQTSESGRTQINRVVQKRSSTAIGTDGGSASAEASNVNVTEQNN